MEQLEKDVEWLKANIKHLSEGQAAMQEAISKIADTMADIHALQNDVTRHGDEINLMRSRYHEQASFMSARPCSNHKTDIERLIMRADDIEQRVESIETEIPTIRLSSSWVFKALLGIVGLLGTVSAGILIHWMEGGFGT